MKDENEGTFYFIPHPSSLGGGQTPGLPATHGNLATVAPFPVWRGSRRSPLCGARSLITCQNLDRRLAMREHSQQSVNCEVQQDVRNYRNNDGQ